MRIDNIQQKYTTLKNLFYDDSSELMVCLKENIQKHGYLPIPFQLAQKKLSNNDIFIALDEIFHQQNTMHDNIFIKDIVLNPLQRMRFEDSSWLFQEQLKIETLSLSGFQEKSSGSFRNFLLKIITTPKGNDELQIPATVFYCLPPYKRDAAFSSVYCPSSIEIDPLLRDEKLYNELHWDTEEQLKLFFELCQLAGHPIILDLLPQTGRFSKTVFVHPQCFLWNDIKSLQQNLLQKIHSHTNPDIQQIFQYSLSSQPLSSESIHAKIYQLYISERKQILKDMKFKPGGEKGVSQQKLQEILLENAEIATNTLELSADISAYKLYTIFVKEDFSLNEGRYLSSFEQCTSLQKSILDKVITKINHSVGEPITSEFLLDDNKHQQLIQEFIEEGLWPLPGGCWNSAGYPIFDHMETKYSTYPVYEHYNYSNNIVSGFAGDMDIVTPWHFAFPHLADQEDNLDRQTIQTYIDYCKSIYSRLSPNGFRIDHLDHSADYPVSVNKKGNSISYRAPLAVFSKLQEEIAQIEPTFTLLAEYMGWGDDNSPHLYHEYSQNKISAGISLDIVGEYRHNVRVMLSETNERLQKFNESVGKLHFTLAHILDNHDRSHPDILRALSEFTRERALLKWIKCLFLPGGVLAQRPTVYLDGNQTHTANKNFARTFLATDPLERNEDINFFIKFDTLYQLSLSCQTIRYGDSKLLLSQTPTQESNNAISIWLVINERNNHQGFLIVANEYIDDNTTPTENGADISIPVPLPYWPIAELILPEENSINTNNIISHEFTEIPIATSSTVRGEQNEQGQTFLVFNNLKHNEFRIYKVFAS